MPFDAAAVPLGTYYLTASYASIRKGIQMILTALASVSCLYFLSFNTPMTDVLSVLKKLHCPDLLVELMLLIYRYIFLLLDISFCISLSQDSRLGNRDLKTSMHHGLRITDPGHGKIRRPVRRHGGTLLRRTAAGIGRAVSPKTD